MSRVTQSLVERGRGFQLFLLHFRYAQVIANWTFPRWDYYFVFDAMGRPGAVLMIYVVFALGFLLGVLRLSGAVKNAAPIRIMPATPGMSAPTRAPTG